ncbi:MAG TPA: winged helix-turn-helix domain-containing protein [Dongiaceae bacterium]|jgi:predicted ATPase/DNA-binding winged helix-turn-helix (wHTH) protein|nr:winged helix-turn-helix domain-containing protein [Dongiaceae bacterium]
MAQSVQSYGFGPFRLVPARRVLSQGGKEIDIRSRPFDLLLALIERRDRVVSKDELLELVWPGRIVEEGNLSVHITSLRKRLGDGVIATVPGRGYRFVAAVEETSETQAPSARPSAPSGNLPRPLSRLIGRQDDLGAISDRLQEYRLVTIVGAGGMGKTRVAIATAERSRDRYPDGVWFADLAPIGTADIVPMAISSMLGVEVSSNDALHSLSLSFAEKRALLVLDGCEHLLESVAALAETLLRACPALAILATSREPLRSEGEGLHRLGPLLAAPPDADVKAEEVRRYPAAELFIERATAADAAFALTDNHVAALMAICRRLDGIPLAIELAAARLAALGIEHLAARLDDRFSFLTDGRRTALPRHQTLRATLDWSYQTLSESEIVVLRRLANFAGSFTLEAAEAVATGEEIPAATVTACISNLVAKSLIILEQFDDALRYRLLDTTREYVRQKLRDCGESNLISRRHAEFYRGLLEGARSEWFRRSTAEWVSIYRREVDNIRAGLDWAFSADGDPVLAVSLSSAAVTLLYDLGLLETCHDIAERALAAIARAPIRNPREEMQLQAALGAALVYVRGPGDATHDAWARTLEIAVDIDDTDYQARALWGLWNAGIYGGTPHVAMEFAQRYRELVAERDDAAALLSYRLIGITQHYLGKQEAAYDNLIYVVERYARDLHRWPTFGFRVDHGIVGRANLARVLWLRGQCNQAWHMIESAVADAQAYGHVMTLQYTLTEGAIPLALLARDLTATQRYLSLLLDPRTSRRFYIWEVCGRCFEAAWLMHSEETASALPRLRNALGKLRDCGFLAPLTFLLAAFAEALIDSGDRAEAATVLEEGLQRCELHGDRWFWPELLRLKGQLLRSEGSIEAAEEYLRQAIAGGRQQGALFWELRAATQLADLRCQSGRAAQAIEVLRPIFQQFTDGFETPDLEAARTMLAQEDRI